MAHRIPPNLQPDCKIYYQHIRYESENGTTLYDTHGGVTIAYRRLQETPYWEVAISQCNLRDNFCKQLGRTIAHNRLNWGDCYRLSLIGMDESKLKKVNEQVRKFVSDKLFLEYCEAPTNTDNEVIIH